MKKIGIDIRLSLNQRGISSYITNLLINYQKLIYDPKIEFYLFTDRVPSEEIKKLNFKIVVLPVKIYPLWDLIIPILLLFYKINLFHSPGNSSPFFKFGKIKYIVTIHDLIFYNTNYSGNLYQQIGRFYLKFNLFVNIYRINKIISVSNSTKFDLIERFKLNPLKISVIYESCHSEFYNRLKPDFSLLNDFICFGSDDPRKNTSLIMKTFDNFVSKHQDYILNIVGLPEAYMEKLKSDNKIQNINSFRFYPHISRSELFTLYNKSIALIYPSLYEGFGVPLVEAFKTNTAVITSDVSSMPEIAGDAAVLINPYSSHELLNALNFIARKENFEFYSVKSKIRGDYFDWEKFSMDTLNLYLNEI